MNREERIADAGVPELLEYAQSHGLDEFDEYDGDGGMLEKLQAFMAAKAGEGDSEAQRALE